MKPEENMNKTLITMNNSWEVEYKHHQENQMLVIVMKTNILKKEHNDNNKNRYGGDEKNALNSKFLKLKYY